MQRAICMSGFCRFNPSDAAAIRLFCFPYAGGNAHVFKALATGLGRTIEVVGVDYPGRGTRFGDLPVRDLHRLIDELAVGIRPLLDKSFAFYGHSNGALVAFELAHRLGTVYYRDAEAVFLAAKRSPTLPAERPVHRLPDDAFVDHLRTYDCTPEEILADRELMSVYLPVLRADFALSETYRLSEQARLRIPIHGLAGTDDALASPSDVLAWRSLTTETFTLHRIAGGHFFLNTHGREVSQLIARTLTQQHFR